MPRMSDERPTYRLDLVALPDTIPAILRLRKVLKLLLRSFGFRCVSAIELPSAQVVEDEEPKT